MIKNRAELIKIDARVYTSLCRYYPNLLNKIYPIKDLKTEVLNYAKKTRKRPKNNSKNKKERQLSSCLIRYCNKNNKYYDKNFHNKLLDLRPEWFEDTVLKNKILLENKYFKKGIKPKGKEYGLFLSYTNKKKNYQEVWTKKMQKLYPFLKKGPKELSYQKMVSLMPKNVKFCKNQKWLGVKHRYFFICNKFGKFKGVPNGLMARTWKNGLSGHPKMGIEKRNKSKYKKVKCLNNNIIYESAFEAAKKLNINYSKISSVCLGKRTHTKRYRFKYVD